MYVPKQTFIKLKYSEKPNTLLTSFLIHLIYFLFLITSYITLLELCKEKLDVDKLFGAKRVNSLN